MSEFKIPPVSTLIGSNLLNYFKIINSGRQIDLNHYLKLILTTGVVCAATPFRIYEDLFYRHKIKEYIFRTEPLFILGHWRSGTTFLHNLLCEDKESGYFTTYHSVFPNNLASGFLFKELMKMNMPSHRPSDNMKLGIDLPQEDEFAIGNCIDKSFYNFFYFPSQYKRYFQHAVFDVNNGVEPGWDTEYRKMIIKALINTNGKRAVIKNPVNTARIQTLLRIFPNAKFIFLYRNPITVFLSTQKFFNSLFPSLWFQKVDKEFINELIFNNYKAIMGLYNEQKRLIPKENLLEIRFEDFEDDPLRYCKVIYNDLLKFDYGNVKIEFEEYISLQKKYVKNKYKVSESVIMRVEKEWGEFLQHWNYKVPDDIDII